MGRPGGGGSNLARLVLQLPVGEQPSIPVDEKPYEEMARIEWDGQVLGVEEKEKKQENEKEGFAYSTREIGEKNDDDVPFPVEIEDILEEVEEQEHTVTERRVVDLSNRVFRHGH
jgi:hypothetical protein